MRWKTILRGFRQFNRFSKWNKSMSFNSQISRSSILLFPASRKKNLCPTRNRWAINSSDEFDVTHYWVFGCPSAYWYYISIRRLCRSPIQYAVFFVELADKLYNHNTLLFLYSAKDFLSHRQHRTGSNMGLEANCVTLRLPP